MVNHRLLFHPWRLAEGRASCAILRPPETGAIGGTFENEARRREKVTRLIPREPDRSNALEPS